jgi:hypothetical protein
MRGKSCAGLNHVLIDNAQRTEMHVPRVVIRIEGKGMPSVEPAVVSASAILAPADGDHVSLLALI